MTFVPDSVICISEADSASNDGTAKQTFGSNKEQLTELLHRFSSTKSEVSECMQHSLT